MLGKLKITSTDKGVSSIAFVEKVQKNNKENEILKNCLSQLEAYFDKKIKQFDVKLDLKGTDFQIRVWQELCKIPYGTTLSYKSLAKKLGDTNKTRAVGLANAKNPVAIIVPCHRVIGATGNLTGYAWGVDKKRQLLQLEGALPQLSLF